MSSKSTLSVADHDWAAFSTLTRFINEAEVEHLLVMPMLEALGFERTDIVPKVPVSFTQGTKRGRPFEADIVTYSCAIHDRDTSLMVVEVKTLGAPLEDAKDQGESYAFQLRTPVLLVTNGQTLQVWQMQVTHQSDLVLEITIPELNARRAEIERVISKLALLKHARRLQLNKITPTAVFSDYEKAELARVQDHTIPRRLETGSGDSISSTALLGSYPKGALIIAPSGYGKTVLSQQLLTQAIKNRWKEPSAPIVADIPLVDFAADGCELVEFFLKRLVAQQPEVTRASLHKALREYGAVIICDGLEYVPSTCRNDTEHKIRLFKRDFPQCQVFIFSRTSIPTKIDLPRLTLLRLNHDEQHQLIASVTTQKLPTWQMPQVLHEICEVPLLLRRIIDYFISNHAFPNAIGELFEHWLTQLREGVAGTPATKARLDSALLLFAHELSLRPVLVGDLLQLVESSGLGSDTFDNLINSGAVVQTNSSVALVHDALGDYLRARALLRLPVGPFEESLAQIRIQDDSLLPALLVSTARSPEHGRMIWKRLESISLRRYVDTVRFAKAGSHPFDAQRREEISSFLANTVDGIEALLRGYFPDVANIIRANLARTPFPLEAITLQGDIEFTDSPKLRYTFFSSSAPRSGFEHAFAHAGQWQTTVDLKWQKLDPASGRYWAATLVSGAIMDMIRSRTFKGGVHLANDRSLSRLEILSDIGLIAFSVKDPISDLLQRLEPHADKFVARVRDTRGLVLPQYTVKPLESDDCYTDAVFTVRSIIEDLEIKHKAGCLTLEKWWQPWGATEEDIFKDPDDAKKYMQAFYARATALYTEIVSANFGSVIECFPYFRAMPFRREVFIFGAPPSRTINWRWFPVANVKESETVCWFEEDLPGGKFESTSDKLHNELIRLGRSTGRSYMAGGGGGFPSPDTAYKEGLDPESPAFSEAVSMAYAEVTFLFDELRL